MANSERPQASDTPRDPIVSLRATVSWHALPAAMPHDTEDGTRQASASCLWARARLPRHVCPRRRATGRRLGRASLFAATERSFDFFEGREIFLEPINMLLHLDDG